jgi:glucan phosphoethanolaminetransferase (alkaline phosphatase superfamily)
MAVYSSENNSSFALIIKETENLKKETNILNFYKYFSSNFIIILYFFLLLENSKQIFGSWIFIRTKNHSFWYLKGYPTSILVILIYILIFHLPNRVFVYEHVP